MPKHNLSVNPVTCAIAVGLLLFVGRLAGCSHEVLSAKSDAPAGNSRQSVMVFAAASTANAIDEIKDQFTRQSGIVVRTSYAASSTLAQQIEHGADAEVFLSADTKWANHLGKHSLVAERRNLLGNRLVVIVPADSTLKVQQLDDLTATAVKHLALGDPSAVPAGRYAKKALESVGLWAQLKDKVVAAADVRQALVYVETGAAEAGIVYATDAAISKSVKIVAEIPEKLTGPVRYPALLLKRGADSPAAQSFYRTLTSPEAVAVFAKYGFTVLKDVEAPP
jgi:molybdate transport system substrate-binding protein